MDEIYVTYVDDEHVDNHDYDDTTDDDHDNNNDIYVSRPDPGRTRTGPRPDRSGPGRATLSGPERASYSSKKYHIKTGLNSK